MHSISMQKKGGRFEDDAHTKRMKNDRLLMEFHIDQYIQNSNDKDDIRELQTPYNHRGGETSVRR